MIQFRLYLIFVILLACTFSSSLANDKMFKYAQSGKVKKIQKFLDTGGSINLRNSDGQTFLMIAVRNNQLELVKHLLQKNAELHTKDKFGKTALSYSVNSEIDGAMMSYLLEAGALDTNKSTSFDKIRLISSFIENGRADLFDVFLSKEDNRDLELFIRADLRTEKYDLDITNKINSFSPKKLTLGGAGFQLKKLVNYTSLEELKVDYLKNEDIATIGNMKNLKKLVLAQNKATTIKELESLSNLEELSIQNDFRSKVDFKTFPTMKNLKRLKIDQDDISDLNFLSGLPMLVDLRIVSSFKSITSYEPISTLKNLETLDLYSFSKEKNITTLSPFAGLRNLRLLKLNKTKVSDFSPLVYLTQLEILELSSPLITDISPLSKLPRLKRLYMEDLQGVDVAPISELATLEELVLRRCGITDISFLQNLKNLKLLWLSDNPVSDLCYLEGLTNLTDLALGSCNLTNIGSLKNLTQLTKLYLSHNRIESVDELANLINLLQLSIHHNNIEDISALSKLKNLKEVLIGYNAIHHVDVAQNWSMLTEFDAESNFITDISMLKGLKKLKKVNMKKNYIYENQASAISASVRTKPMRGRKDMIQALLSIQSLLEDLEEQNRLSADLLNDMSAAEISGYIDQAKKQIKSEVSPPK